MVLAEYQLEHKIERDRGEEAGRVLYRTENDSCDRGDQSAEQVETGSRVNVYDPVFSGQQPHLGSETVCH